MTGTEAEPSLTAAAPGGGRLEGWRHLGIEVLVAARVHEPLGLRQLGGDGGDLLVEPGGILGDGFGGRARHVFVRRGARAVVAPIDVVTEQWLQALQVLGAGRERK